MCARQKPSRTDRILIDYLDISRCGELGSQRDIGSRFLTRRRHSSAPSDDRTAFGGRMEFPSSSGIAPTRSLGAVARVQIIIIMRRTRAQCARHDKKRVCARTRNCPRRFARRYAWMQIDAGALASSDSTSTPCPVWITGAEGVKKYVT